MSRIALFFAGVLIGVDALFFGKEWFIRALKDALKEAV